MTQFHVSKPVVEKILLDLLELKKEMTLSNTKSEEAKTRDYKVHEQKQYELIRRIGLLFYVKLDPYKVAKETFKSEEPTEDQLDVTSKVAAFFPKVDKDTVELLIKIFSGVGIHADHNDFLMIFRHFHTLKYK